MLKQALQSTTIAPLPAPRCSSLASTSHRRTGRVCTPKQSRSQDTSRSHTTLAYSQGHRVTLHVPDSSCNPPLNLPVHEFFHIRTDPSNDRNPALKLRTRRTVKPHASVPGHRAFVLISPRRPFGSHHPARNPQGSAKMNNGSTHADDKIAGRRKSCGLVVIKCFHMFVHRFDVVTQG